MEKQELLEKLQDAISGEERKKLKVPGALPVNEFNRKTLLELLDRTASLTGRVSEKRVKELAAILEQYLGQYLSDGREKWKWIILSCVYLAFLCERPLHPQDSVHYRIREEDGQTIYECPCKSPEEGTACSFCVCRRKIVKK